jgi:hypothetical protein
LAKKHYKLVPELVPLTLWGISAYRALAQQQSLSSKSDKAIDKAAKKYGYDASAFENAMTQSGSKYKLDPNLLVCGRTGRDHGAWSSPRGV